MDSGRQRGPGKGPEKSAGLIVISHSYEDRLKELGLQTLEERRHQADMHMMHDHAWRWPGLQHLVHMGE